MKESLASLQRRFADAIVDTTLPVPAILPGGSLTPEGALGVYRVAYPARLTEALIETYPSVRRALGDEAFFRACRSYIAGHPSVSHNLSDYGADFAAAVPEHAETARYDWEVKELFHQKEHAHAAPEALAACGPDSRLRIGAAVRLRPHHLASGRWLVLYKKGEQVWTYELAEPELRVIERLRDGASLEQALGTELTQERAAALFAFVRESGIVEQVVGGTS